MRLKLPQMYVIVSGGFHSGHEAPIAVAVTQKEAIDWLKANNWQKCRGKHNKGLWEQECYPGRWEYAKIIEVPLAKIEVER